MIAYPQTLEAIQDVDLQLRLSMSVAAKDKYGCMFWLGHRDSKGYGQIKYNGTAQWVHRLVFALKKGRIPAGFQVHHECYNPSCVNPDHLSLLTVDENRVA